MIKGKIKISLIPLKIISSFINFRELGKLIILGLSLSIISNYPIVAFSEIARPNEVIFLAQFIKIIGISSFISSILINSFARELGKVSSYLQKIKIYLSVLIFSLPCNFVLLFLLRQIQLIMIL